MKSFLYAEVGNLLLNSVFSSDPVRGELSGSHWGKSFLETWAIVSTSVDVATVGVSFRNSYKEVEHVIDPRLSLQGKKRLEGIVAGVGKEAPTIYENVKYDDFISTVGDFANGAKKELADEAYKLWGEEKWEELYKLFNPVKGDQINGGWPPFDGATGILKTERGDQLAGKIFDRFQVTESLSVFFASPLRSSTEGVADLVFTYDSRALANRIEDGTHYIKFKLKGNLPSDLSFEYGEAIPWFKLPGNADQVKSSINLGRLNTQGQVEVLEILKYDGQKKAWIKIK